MLVFISWAKLEISSDKNQGENVIIDYGSITRYRRFDENYIQFSKRWIFHIRGSILLRRHCCKSLDTLDSKLKRKRNRWKLFEYNGNIRIKHSSYIVKISNFFSFFFFCTPNLIHTYLMYLHFHFNRTVRIVRTPDV